MKFAITPIDNEVDDNDDDDNYDIDDQSISKLGRPDFAWI